MDANHRQGTHKEQTVQPDWSFRKYLIRKEILDRREPVEGI
jgi:hypothetical protein